MNSNKVKTTLYLDKALVAATKVRAVEKRTSLTREIEEALRNSFSPAIGAIGIDLNMQGGTIVSGPTISTMKPIYTNPALGVAVPGQAPKANSTEGFGKA